MRHAARDAQLLMFSIGTSSSCLVMLCEMASLWYCYGSPSFTCSMLAAISASPLPSRAPAPPCGPSPPRPGFFNSILTRGTFLSFQGTLGGGCEMATHFAPHRTTTTTTTTATILAMALPAR